MNTSVWLSASLQVPCVAVANCGRAEPKSCDSDWEKVMRIGAAGASVEPGAGSTTATGIVEAGNQLTVTARPVCSQLCAAAATRIVPTAVARGSATTVSGWGGSACPSGADPVAHGDDRLIEGHGQGGAGGDGHPVPGDVGHGRGDGRA